MISTLSPEQWRAVSPYLDEALTLTSEAREAWLESLRVKDGVLASQVEALLNEKRAAEEKGFLEKGPAPVGEGLSGQMVGAYRLTSVIGQGGMGTVWLAERSDGRFKGRAAVKFLNVALVGRGGEERFKREGAILARLSHAHIAKLLDAGVSSLGHPYLVLEYIEGRPIDGYCDERNSSIQARLGLFLSVLDAIAHAHANLIVHRDIKPSNVLVSQDGQVTLLDFGIAKLLEGEGQDGAATLLTREAGSALTPEYAAPEQITGEPVTTATDVYELGVLLFVLLTGQHPAGPGPHSPAELLKSILEREPPRPSEVVTSGTKQAVVNAERRGVLPETLRRQLRGDLDTIVLKTLKKHPDGRYASVNALAEDLGRYLRNEPISARPDTLTYRVSKFVRRHRTAVLLSSIAMVATLGGLVGTVLQARKVKMERDFSLKQVERSEVLNEFHQFLLSDAAPSGKSLTVNELLRRAEQIVERQHAGHDANRVQLMISIGRQYLEQDEQASGRRVLEQAYTLSRGLPDMSVRAAAACTLAGALARDFELQRAEALYQEGLKELPAETQFALERVNCLQSGMEIVQETGNIREGVARAEAAQRVLRESPFDSDVLELLRWTDLGKAYSSAGQDAKAVSAYERAGTLLSSAGRDQTGSAAILFNNWGLALDQIGRPLEAERLYRRALDLGTGDRREDSSSPVLLCNYARSLRELNRLDEAADYADRAYGIAQRTGDEVTRVLLERAKIYMAQRNPLRAAVILADVEARLKKSLPDGHFALGVLASEKALNALLEQDVTSSLALANRAVSIVESAIKAGSEGGYYLPRILTRRSVIWMAAQRPTEAADDAARAVFLFQAELEPGRFSSHLGNAYLALGQALLSQGKPEEARVAFGSAAQNLESTVGMNHPDCRTARDLAGALLEGPKHLK